MLLKNDGHYNNYKRQDSDDSVWQKTYYIFVCDEHRYLLAFPVLKPLSILVTFRRCISREIHASLLFDQLD